MKKIDNLNRINIVLVEPEDCQNIGSVCRAAKTMGITHLKIVGRDEFDEQRVRQLSVHAFDLFENKRLFSTLEDALCLSSLSVAFSRRNGKFRKGTPFSLPDLVKLIEKYGDGDIDLVFGRESDGLTDKEIQACNLTCTIATSDIFPSLNLSQAVQIAVYSLYTGLSDYVSTNDSRVVTQARAQVISHDSCEFLDDINYFKNGSEEKENFNIFLRDCIMRGAFSEREAGYIAKFFKKVHDISKYKNK